MPLSDVKVRNAKAQVKQYKLADSEGMYLLVTPAGGKCWRLKYRFGGKEKTLALGQYPTVTLADARIAREEAKKQLAKGVDPGEVKQAVKKEKKAVAAPVTAGPTFEKVARDWHQEFYSTWSTKHADGIMTRLENDAFFHIGARPIAELRAPEVLQMLKKIQLRTAETAFRVKTACSQIFRYAIAHGYTDRDPVADLRGALPPVKNNNFAAPTNPRNVGPLLRAIDGYTGSPVVKCAMQLAPLVFVRPGELRHAEWMEIDLEAAEWNIPGEKMKMKTDHLVPLSRQALEILKRVHEITGGGRYVFPCSRSPLRCMSENSVNAGLRRLGFEKEEITGHGFRATARTILDEVLEFRPDIIEHQLAHAVRDPNGRAYNRTSHLPARMKMMQRWADYLDRLKGEKSSLD